MNFHKLENKKQYEYTKQQVEVLERQLEDLAKKWQVPVSFIALADHTYYAKNIMEAEVREYEARKQKEKDNIIDVEDIFAIQKFRKRINSLSLEKITFCYRGRKIRIDKAGIKDWELTGLTIIDFVKSYEKEIKKNLKAGRIIESKSK